jgi:hypothetical protein
MSPLPFSGPKKQLSRKQAIERYILLRLRVEDIKRLGFLVEGLHAGTIQLPKDVRVSRDDLRDDLKDAVRNSFFRLVCDVDR